MYTAPHATHEALRETHESNVTKRESEMPNKENEKTKKIKKVDEAAYKWEWLSKNKPTKLL